MLTKYFKKQKFLNRLRSGPIGPFAEGFVEHLEKDGFSACSICQYLGVVAHLGHWASKHHVDVENMDEGTCKIFLQHFRTCRCKPKQKKSGNVKTPVWTLLAYLQKKTGTPIRQKTCEDSTPLFDDFNYWMREHRGIMLSTLRLYKPTILNFLSEVKGDPSRFDSRMIRRFVLKCRQPSSTRNCTTAIRMFLRFLIAEGKCSPGLDAAVPIVASWRLSALPRYLPPSDVESILNSCDLSTPLGLRDRAILILLARLALRAGDIVDLKLDDIDWSQSTIRVSGKARKEVQLPLTQEVGDAIYEYLSKGRQAYAGDHLFIRALAPLRPFTSQAVSSIVLRAIRRAGVRSSCCGAYVLRHSAATQMLRQGASLNEIGSVLRHRSIATTAIYAKVDLALLQFVTQPWPEVLS